MPIRRSSDGAWANTSDDIRKLYKTVRDVGPRGQSSAPRTRRSRTPAVSGAVAAAWRGRRPRPRRGRARPARAGRARPRCGARRPPRGGVGRRGRWVQALGAGAGAGTGAAGGVTRRTPGARAGFAAGTALGTVRTRGRTDAVIQ